MAIPSKLIDVSSLVTLESLTRHTQKDDIAFLLVAILTGFFYYFYVKDKHDPYHYLWFDKPQATASGTTKIETRDIGVKLEESNKDFVIFWGSQSGTAETLANRLVRDCRSRFGLDTLAADLSDYDPESLANIPQSKFAIFIVSTYGEGDPSDNATKFVSWLHSNKSIQFHKLRYAAFGLGNKKYKFYNRVIDVVVEALDRFGAQALMPTGRADDSIGTTDEDFTEWKQSLFTFFRNDLGLEEKPEQYEPVLKITEDTSLDVIDLHVGKPVKSPLGKKSATAVSPIHALSIKHASKLLTTDVRNCLHIELDINEFPELKYKTGDHLAVWPSNPNSEIQLLVKVLGLEHHMQTPLLIASLDSSTKVKVPSPTTWEALFQNYLEICAPVPREIVLALAQFAPDNTSKATLKQLGEDKDAYHTFCSRYHITFARLLQHVTTPGSTWSGIPTSFIIESLPTLSPRYYSISSSSVVSPKNISITVATSSELPPTHNAPIPRLTTEYLLAIEQKSNHGTSDDGLPYNLSGPNNTLENGTKLYAHVRKSKFRLPTIPKTPIIMIASGSGIAPFRGFLTERARLANIGREVGPSHLFFGCRSQSEYLYKDELNSIQTSTSGVEITTAFSRTDTNVRGGKCYVQDRVAEKDEELVRLLVEENAYFYICGSAGMARDVAERLGECMRAKLGWDEVRLREWSEGMRKTHRWQEDVWG